MSNSRAAFVLDRAYDNYAKRLQRQMLRQYGRSLSWVGIQRQVNADYVTEVHSDLLGCFVLPGWRDAMKAIAEAHAQVER